MWVCGVCQCVRVHGYVILSVGVVRVFVWVCGYVGVIRVCEDAWVCEFEYECGADVLRGCECVAVVRG